MIETARLKHDLRAYKAMCRELVAAMDCYSNVGQQRVRDKAVEMLDNERTVWDGVG